MISGELKVELLSVKDKHCIGCKRHESFAMLTFMSKEMRAEHKFLDVFLSREQALELVDALKAVLEGNVE